MRTSQRGHSSMGELRIRSSPKEIFAKRLLSSRLRISAWSIIVEWSVVDIENVLIVCALRGVR